MKVVFRIVIVTSLASLGMGSCSTGVEEACRQQLPAFNQQLIQVTHELARYTPASESNRAIASVSSDPSQNGIEQINQVFDLPKAQRIQWQDWSEKRLVDVQRYLDFVHTHSQYRPALTPLSELANELVKFDGYVDQGKALQAIASLHRAQANADEVTRATCTTAQTPTER